MMTSERLVFGKYTEQDFPLYHALLTDAELMTYIAGRALTEEEVRSKFEQLKVINAGHALAGIFLVREKNTMDSVGLCKLEMNDGVRAEVGYMAHKQFWGKGYASEMTRVMIDLASSLPEIETLYGIVDPENAASKRILEKFGFKLYKTGMSKGQHAEFYEKPNVYST